jgi:hypothetical protein
MLDRTAQGSNMMPPDVTLVETAVYEMQKSVDDLIDRYEEYEEAGADECPSTTPSLTTWGNDNDEAARRAEQHQPVQAFHDQRRLAQEQSDAEYARRLQEAEEEERVQAEELQRTQAILQNLRRVVPAVLPHHENLLSAGLQLTSRAWTHAWHLQMSNRG